MDKIVDMTYSSWFYYYYFPLMCKLRLANFIRLIVFLITTITINNTGKYCINLHCLTKSRTLELPIAQALVMNMRLYNYYQVYY